RYFGLLGFFTFAMLGLVLANNLLMLYVFWELVGLSSYLLIGFWYQKRKAYRAAKKAFLVNRLGDVGLLIGLILTFLYFDTWEIEMIKEKLQEASLAFNLANWELGIIALCLFCGALAKSAQFPLHFWLPDAMEGPTPVSALIHAATMVAAGVYLMARFYFLINLDAGIGMAFIGAITIFLGAFSALVQNDIKKVLAYSTISQLGYMILALGVGGYTAGLFHLFTHAFFKAGLFLGAGAIIHALHKLEKKVDFQFDPQNIYLMGGLGKKLPFVFLTFSICSLSLCGLPLFSGFLSKDSILIASWAWAEALGQGGSWLFYLIPLTAFMGVFLTALYMGRLLWLVFGGSFVLDKLYRRKQKAFALLEDIPNLMKIPLGLFAFMSLAFVFSLNPVSAEGSWLLSLLAPPDWG
ncbi:MAG: NADH-quinone oxidoreductase subunit L, partial [Bacteroidota bacterium]